MVPRYESIRIATMAGNSRKCGYGYMVAPRSEEHKSTGCPVSVVSYLSGSVARNVSGFWGRYGKSLNETALAVLRRQVGKHPSRVFTYNRRPFDRASTLGWMKALKRAGIENFRWHDLRHTWASWLAQKGVPLNDIQEMGAWETAAMVRRYAHLSPAHLSHRAKVIDGLIDTDLAQSPNAKSIST